MPELSTWEKFKAWLFDFGEDVFNFLKTPTALTIRKYRPVGKRIVLQAVSYPGTGEEKFKYACGLFLKEVPGLALFIVETIIQSAYETEVMPIEKPDKIIDMNLDTDGDGIPDWKDLCREIGDQGCGVDENGCPKVCGDPPAAE